MRLRKSAIRECVTVSYYDRSSQAHLIFDPDVDEDRFLVAELNSRLFRIYKKMKGLFAANMRPADYMQLATEAVTIL